MLNIKISELIHSKDAVRYNINNMPSVTAIDNMQTLIHNVLQPTREHFGKPMIITSGYRSPALNRKLKEKGYNPSTTSQHCFGEAADFVIRNISLILIVKFIVENLQFDQIILEHDNGANWVHVSYREGRLRKQVLQYKNGKYESLKI